MQKRLEVERTYFSLFPQTEFVSLSSMYKCKYVRCYICQIYLLRKNEFTFAVCDKTYKVRGKLNCNSYNDIDFINCKLCVQDKQVKHLYIEDRRRRRRRFDQNQIVISFSCTA